MLILLLPAPSNTTPVQKNHFQSSPLKLAMTVNLLVPPATKSPPADHYLSTNLLGYWAWAELQ